MKWKIPVAVEILQLKELHGINMDEAHDAGFDCRITHLILEELRRRAGI